MMREVGGRAWGWARWELGEGGGNGRVGETGAGVYGCRRM